MQKPFHYIVPTLGLAVIAVAVATIAVRDLPNIGSLRGSLASSAGQMRDIIKACGQSEAPACNGLCGDGEVCTALDSEDGKTCECHLWDVESMGTCGASTTPICNGTCLGGNECYFDVSNGVCKCTESLSRACNFRSAPICGGGCEEPNKSCIAVQGSLFTKCECLTPEEADQWTSCNDSAPTCSANCPEGYTCVAGPGESCACQAIVLPSEPTCGDSFPTCGGTCAGAYLCQQNQRKLNPDESAEGKTIIEDQLGNKYVVTGCECMLNPEYDPNSPVL